MVAEACDRCTEHEGLLRYVVPGGGSGRGLTQSGLSEGPDEQDVWVYTCDPST